MPTSYQVKLPPPTDWQELQRMTCDLYRKLWSNEDLQEFGSIGQKQDGVDVFGFVDRTKDVGGIQCKCVVSLTPYDVEKEYKKSCTFSPRLAKYVIVTTSKRDTEVQQKAVELTRDGPHSCTVVFWEDFCQRLSEHKDVLRKYYPDFVLYEIEGDSAGKLIEVNIGVSRYKILVSRLPSTDRHYGGTILISDLQSQKCISYCLGDHWSRLEGIVGITRCDAFLVSSWLNSFADIGELLRLGFAPVAYELTAEDQAEAEQQGFILLKRR